MKYNQKYHKIDGEIYTRRYVHQLTMGDVDEFDLYANVSVYDWLEKTEKGQFIKKHGKDITYESMIDATFSFGHKIAISAMISDRHWTMFMLQYAS